MRSPEGLSRHREGYVDAIRAYNRESKSARTWPLQFLLKRTCYHLLDHAWEMEDKDLSGSTQESE